MTNDEMIARAVEAGFAAAEVIDTDKIVFDPMFRPFCEENLCGQYGVNYACPPDCGTVEQMKARVLAHKKGLVLQTIVQIADYADNEAFKLGKKLHNEASIRLMQEFRQAGVPGFLIGASGCALCSPCALRSGEPCRFPDSRYFLYVRLLHFCQKTGRPVRHGIRLRRRPDGVLRNVYFRLTTALGCDILSAYK